MEYVTFAFLLILIILFVIFQSVTGIRLKRIARELKNLKAQKPVAPVNRPAQPQASTVSQPVPVPPVVTPPVKASTDNQVKPPIVAQPEAQPIQPVQPQPATVPPQQPKASPQVVMQQAQQQPQVKKAVKKPRERKFDLENFIGIKLLVWFAVTVLVLGIGFFVKYAIDNEWINEATRVAIGVLSGGILILLGHFTHKKYHVFSSFLAGAGIAVLYFVIAIGYQMYGLFGQEVAFAIMVVITAFSVLLSLFYKRQELAIVALVGGFCTPLMVSNGTGKYEVLFSYLLILNSGMLILAYFRKWTIINIISFAFTVLLYGAWLISAANDETKEMPHMGALLFAALFYLEFFVMNIINNLTKGKKFGILEFTILLCNSACFYGAGIFILHSYAGGVYQGLFTAIMALFNLAFTIFFYRKSNVDKNFVYLLIVLVLSFISLLAPAQLEGNYITLFWATEAVLLLWLGMQLDLKVVRLASAILLIVMINSLVVDWIAIYDGHPENLAIVFNKGFMTTLAAVASLAISTLMLRLSKLDKFTWGISVRVYQWVLTPFILLVIYFGGLVEIELQVHNYIDFNASETVFYGCFNLLYFTGIMVWAKLSKNSIVKYSASGLAVLSGILYMAFYHFQFVKVRTGLLDPSYTDSYYFFDTENITNDVIPLHFNMHYVAFAAILAMCVLLVVMIRNLHGKTSWLTKGAVWYGITVLLFVVTSELDHIVMLSQYVEGDSMNDIIRQSRKIGYPILWGVSSFILMVIGMVKHRQDLRIYSLSLFFVTLIKLFTYDIQDIHPAGKIAAFISLGVLLLVVSFMYQRIKWLVLEKDKEEARIKELEEQETLNATQDEK